MQTPSQTQYNGICISYVNPFKFTSEENHTEEGMTKGSPFIRPQI